jgi:hypothetical protein
VKTGMSLAAAVLCCSCASIVPLVAGADPWEVRREMREGARSVDIERHEAAREIRRCQTRDCVAREIREGRREVNRERHEARHEIHRAQAGKYTHPARYNRNVPYYGDGRYSSYNYVDRDAHYHPGGQYCRDGRHIAHLRDGYYRADRRWYRDGRYWNEYDYVNRYYGGRNRHHDDDDDDDLLRGGGSPQAGPVRNYSASAPGPRGGAARPMRQRSDVIRRQALVANGIHLFMSSRSNAKVNAKNTTQRMQE